MVGYYASNGDAAVMNCYANFADHNASYVVTGFGEWDDATETYFAKAGDEDFWKTYLTGFDTETVNYPTVWDFETEWEFVRGNYSGLKFPYVRLILEGVKSAAEPQE